MIKRLESFLFGQIIRQNTGVHHAHAHAQLYSCSADVRALSLRRNEFAHGNLFRAGVFIQSMSGHVSISNRRIS